MPELPDITAYIDALAPRVLGQPLERVRIGNPFVIRTIRPGPDELIGQTVPLA
jgi:formamidopyrimidine-DNA glycosylase